jgi:uncharacterized membrane protein YedE/YeeE
MNILTQPWPWYIAGPLIGLMVPALLIIGNRPFGLSSTLRHICAACIPTKVKFFQYDWKAESWNLLFVFGIALGGLVAGYFFQNPNPIRISEHTVNDLNAMGVKNYSGLVPEDIFNFKALLTLRGFVLKVVSLLALVPAMLEAVPPATQSWGFRTYSGLRLWPPAVSLGLAFSPHGLFFRWSCGCDLKS